MTEITTTIIALNEANNIANAIDSAKLFSDEIIVVDSGSTDKTIQISKDLGVKVYQHIFQNYADQKNFAISKSSADWIFSLDADEVVSKELASEIKTAIQSDQFVAYLIPRRNFILGGEIKHSRWSPDKHVWLFKKTAGRWQGSVHEEVIVDGKVGQLKKAKLHYQDKTTTEFINKLNDYTTIEAQYLYKKGKRFSIATFLYEPLRSFVGRYFVKQGYLDGWRGFCLCSLRAIYKAIVWIKILELQNR